MSRALLVLNSQANRDLAARWVQQMPQNTSVEFKHSKRSLPQNAKLWAMLQEVAEQVEWYGLHLSAEDWKVIFTASLRKTRVVPGLDHGSFVPLGMSTSKMTKSEMSDLIELMHAFGAEHGVVFSDGAA